MSTKEYGSTLTLTDIQIRDIRENQWAIRYYGLEKNENALVNALKLAPGVLSLAFMLPTPITLAAGVVSMITSMPGMKAETIAACLKGESYLQELEISMRDHPEWQAVKVRLPFLEFIEEDFRIVAGRGTIEAMKVDGGWLTA